MKKMSLIFILLVLVTLLSACGNNSDKEISLARLVALEEGNYWKYNGYGNEYASLERKVLYKEGNRVQIIDGNPGTTMVTIYEITDEKVSVVYSEGEFYEETNILSTENNMDQPILVAPVKENETWESNGNKYTIISVNESVETDAGNFEECVLVKVEYPENPAYSNIYYKADLGMVKQDYIDEELDFKVTTVLSEYQVKGYK
ncbi:MAG: hypothetical protein EOM04_04610 [Clostridia bacterium]|jgi:hypothetical protein|nr:hypothetical protein [Clostridia bacterium]